MSTTSLPIPNTGIDRLETTPKIGGPSLPKLMIQSLRSRLADLLSLPVDSVRPISSNDRMRLAQQAAQLMQKGTLTFPQVFMRMSTVSGAQDYSSNTYNPVRLYRAGIEVLADDNENSTMRLHLAPAQFNFEVIYQTDSFDTSIEFPQRWITGGLRNALNSTIVFAGAYLDIKCVLSTSIDLPELDKSIEIPNYYEISTSVQVQGYVVSTHRQDTDVEPKIRTVHLTGVFDTQDYVKNIIGSLPSTNRSNHRIR